MQRLSEVCGACCTWVYRLALANLLWWCVTLGGGVVLGLFPATVATAALVTAWLRGEEPERLVRWFVRTSLEHARRALLVGYVMLSVALVLALDLRLVLHHRLPAGLVVAALTGLAAGLWVVTATALPLVVVRENTAPAPQQLRLALWSGLSDPLGALLVLVALTASSLLMTRYPGLVPFFSTSPLLLLAAWWSGRHRSRVAGADDTTDASREAEDRAHDAWVVPPMTSGR